MSLRVIVWNYADSAKSFLLQSIIFVNSNVSSYMMREDISFEKVGAVSSKDVMNGARYCSVDPYEWIPFAIVRATSHSGIIRLVSIFRGRAPGKLGFAGGGMMCGRGTVFLTRMYGNLLWWVHDHLKTNGMSEHDAQFEINSRDCWYGIIEGINRWQTIVLLMGTRFSSKAIKWRVILARADCSAERHFQLWWMQNM